jgi:hypothetical protein
MVLGTVVALAVLSSRLYYGNNRLFTACVLWLAGLGGQDASQRLIRTQVSLVYGEAGLNKLLDPDWRSGQFFETWTAPVPHHQRLRSQLPLSSLAFSRIVSWLVIGVELFLAIGFSVRALVPAAIWTGVLYHTLLLFDTGSTFNMFYVAMLSAYLAGVDWPAERVAVGYDPASRILGRVRALLELADREGLLQWRPDRQTRGGLRVTVGARRLEQWAAVRALVLYNPLSYLTFVAALAALQSRRALRWVAAAGVAVLCLPPPLRWRRRAEG